MIRFNASFQSLNDTENKVYARKLDEEIFPAHTVVGGFATPTVRVRYTAERYGKKGSSLCI